jgi:hypothetical protein
MVYERARRAARKLGDIVEFRDVNTFERGDGLVC